MRTQILRIARAFSICFLLAMPRYVQAQISNANLRVVNRVVSLDKSSKVVRLNEVDSVGIAWIVGEHFTEGDIEFDVKGIDKYQGSFVGIAFHGADDRTYEAVYFRPFNFKATDTLRKLHAIQYMSIPKFDWPVLRDRFPGKYEKAMASGIDPNGWFHVKLVIIAESLSIYINRSKVPVLQTELLSQTEGEMIGYWVGNGSGGEWKNLKIKKRK